MGNSTENLNLYLTDMDTDGNDTFDFDRDLNENWDKIDKNFALYVYQADKTYKKGTWVVGVVNGKKSIYESLVDDNTGNTLTDADYWEEVNADNDFSNVTAPVKDFIDMVISWGIPDWAGGFAIPTSYTTPSAGLVFATFTATTNISPSLTINGKNIWYDYNFNGSMRVVVGKGDNLDFSRTSNRYFYPLKGVK